FGLSVLAGVLFGLAPALQAGRRGLRDRMSRSSRSVTGGNELTRNILVISEIALAIVLVTGAGLLLKSFMRLSAVDPGFRPENVATMTVDLPREVYRTPEQMQAFHSGILSRVSSLPGVAGAGAVNWNPLGGQLIMGDFQLDDGRKLPQGFMVDK